MSQRVAKRTEIGCAEDIYIESNSAENCPSAIAKLPPLRPAIRNPKFSRRAECLQACVCACGLWRKLACHNPRESPGVLEVPSGNLT